MARRGRGCVAPGCERRAEPGTVVCIDHRWSALGTETEREVRLMTQRLTEMSRLETAEARQETARAFRQQVMRGEYAAVFGMKFEEMLADSGREHDLTGEIGMLKIAMRRVLTEEEEPARMAHGLAKLAGALGRAITLQETRDRTEGAREESQLIDTLNQMLVDIEKEARINRTPWLVDPHNPPQHVADELRRRQLAVGSPEAVLWVEQWRYWLTKKRAARGFKDAQEALANGLVEVHGELGEGLPRNSLSIDTGSGFGYGGWDL